MWEVEYTDEFDDWWSALDDDEQEKITAAVETLQEHGPNLKRPIVGKLEGTRRHHQLKELIPPSSTIRVIFAFDPRSQAILLLGGDKAGNWKRWYDENIPVAEDLYDTYLAQLESEGLI